MKKMLLSISFLPFLAFSQICNPAGNVMLFSNYNGGVLNINIDANIPNLKIGVVSFGGSTINLSGPYVNNVTEVIYAGYNSTSALCGPAINTSINGAPSSAYTEINTNPAATLSNPNGCMYISCASYSCDLNSWQGGCNTLDQVEAYFQTKFNGVLFAHYLGQYSNCWSGTYSISNGGTCCIPQPLDANTSSTNATCHGVCDGTASITAFGGIAPYSYLWDNGLSASDVSGLCAGTYIVTVTDADGSIIDNTVVITEPQEISGNFANTDETGVCDGIATIFPIGGTPPYTFLWDAPLNQTTATATGLCEGSPCVAITDSNGCSVDLCTTIVSTVGIEELVLKQKELMKIIDITGRETEYKPNTVLIYLYSDGTCERIFDFKH